MPRVKKHNVDFWKSWLAWTLMSIYLVLAFVSFREALTCTGWVCDLVALPAIFPLGFPIAWLTDWLDSLFYIPGHTPTFHLRNWYFILPTVFANAFFYFFLGWLLHRLVKHLRSSGRDE